MQRGSFVAQAEFSFLAVFLATKRNIIVVCRRFDEGDNARNYASSSRRNRERVKDQSIIRNREETTAKSKAFLASLRIRVGTQSSRAARTVIYKRCMGEQRDVASLAFLFLSFYTAHPLFPRITLRAAYAIPAMQQRITRDDEDDGGDGGA